MVTVGRGAYDLMYRFGAPWEGADRVELRSLVRSGRCSPATLRRPGASSARAIDIGCGAGGVSIELAEAGFEVTGVDFSAVALRKARAAAARHGLGPERIRFLAGDLTSGGIPGVEGPYDLLVDYGTLDDLPEAGRRALAGYLARLARPGSLLFLFAFAGRPEDLPRFSFGGPSRAFPGLVPGEVEALFEPAFRVEVLDAPTATSHIGTWLLERRDGIAAPVARSATAASGAAAAVPSTLLSASGGGLSRRTAARLTLASGVLAAVGIVFLGAMFAAFAAGAPRPALVFGWINDVLGLISMALTIPAVLAIGDILRPSGAGRSRLLTGIGVAGAGAIVVLQALLVAGVLTFEQQIGPVMVAMLVLDAWFIGSGYVAGAVGALPKGGRMGLLAATYVGYPFWAVWLSRHLAAMPERGRATTSLIHTER